MKKFLKISAWTVAVLTALALVLLVVGGKVVNKVSPALTENPETGKWYSIAPEGALSADGSPWRGLFRKGKENKVIFLFFGGGVSLDDYTAARGYSIDSKHGYYSDNVARLDFVGRLSFKAGIGSSREDNPFRDWTIVAFPYSTGDFHCGAGEYKYTGLDGKEHVLHHRGYSNYEKTLEQVLPLLGSPEAVLVTGFSGGAFGTALLSSDLASRFPENTNITAYVDAGLLIKDNWHDVAVNQWHAPDSIASFIVSDNITLDGLKALHRKHPGVKILFECSVRDAAFSNYQAYIDRGDNMTTTKEDGDRFNGYLRQMVKDFREAIPEGGLFLWDDIVSDEKEQLTLHTIEMTHHFFDDRAGNGSIAEWVAHAVNGDVYTKGLDLLDHE